MNDFLCWNVLTDPAPRKVSVEAFLWAPAADGERGRINGESSLLGRPCVLLCPMLEPAMIINN